MAASEEGRASLWREPWILRGSQISIEAAEIGVEFGVVHSFAVVEVLEGQSRITRRPQRSRGDSKKTIVLANAIDLRASKEGGLGVQSHRAPGAADIHAPQAATFGARDERQREIGSFQQEATSQRAGPDGIFVAREGSGQVGDP